jgi:asparagine synthase (glutamine-hydrolysing)
MCGLVAILSYGDGRDPVDRSELTAIRDSMVPRGPDGHGLWISADARIGLAHRRLSLLDLSTAGAQPMANSDNSLRVVFNGEIYNYLDLRRELEADGYTFHSGSDTEVLLHLYDSKGEHMVDDLRGMYAFVIWDDRRKLLFAARDPFGIKPLYLSDDGHSLRIASQVKALVAGRGIDTSREAAGQVGFLLLGYVPEPFTLYKNIQAFPAGACMTMDATGKRSVRHFCNIKDEMARFDEKTQSSQVEDMRLAFRACLTNSVRRHLIADVPVASFLSGGLDSATITALASQESLRKLHTVTLGFEEYRDTANDETACARGIADFYQTEHHTQWFSRAEFELELPRILGAMDQPSIDGINTYFVSKAARTLGVKTALSGLGGDELFGTYPSFRDVPRIVQLLRGNPITLGGVGQLVEK